MFSQNNSSQDVLEFFFIFCSTLLSHVHLIQATAAGIIYKRKYNKAALRGKSAIPQWVLNWMLIDKWKDFIVQCVSGTFHFCFELMVL